MFIYLLVKHSISAPVYNCFLHTFKHLSLPLYRPAHSIPSWPIWRKFEEFNLISKLG